MGSNRGAAAQKKNEKKRILLALLAQKYKY
jgi:hypothetical protein